MESNSRTTKSLRNSIVALLFFGIEFFLKFYSRKIFLDYLGTEILGLNTTATNLLQFLNLAELGIGAAVGFTLYKPICDKDTNTINDIITLQGQLYRRIAWAVISGSVVLMAFFPWIFAKTELPLWYAYASFSVLLFSALLSYFINYKQILLTASQLDYKVQIGYRSWMIVKVVCQTVAIARFADPYIWWLILEAGFAVVATVSLDRVTRRTFPDLKTDTAAFGHLKTKYSSIIVKVKQIFFHKVSGFILSQTSPIIIYAYLSLTVVAMYGNYFMIISGLTLLFDAAFNSMTAGIGNLIAEGEKKTILSVFDELFSIKFLIIAVICFCAFILTGPFVALWIGEQYLLPTTTLALMIGILFIGLSRTTVESYLNAFGLYQDIWAPITEAVLNLGLSVLLGYYWGLNGILTGVLISLLLIVFIWKPIFLFRCGLHTSIGYYAAIYGKHIALGVSAVLLWYLCHDRIAIDPFRSWSCFLSYALCNGALFGAILASFMFATKCGIVKFVSRLKNRMLS